MSTKMTSFSTSLSALYTTPFTCPSRAHETWNAFKHLGLTHWILAPWALFFSFVHALHFCARVIDFGATHPKWTEAVTYQIPAVLANRIYTEHHLLYPRSVLT